MTLVLGRRGEIVVEAGRLDGRHEIRPDFASGPPGRRYRQKTILTSDDLRLCWDLGNLVAVTAGWAGMTAWLCWLWGSSPLSTDSRC